MVPAASPISEAERRARRYWFVDGLPQILGGLAQLIFAGVLWFWMSPGWSIVDVAIGFVLLLFSLSLTRADRTILGWIKSRITYPRTGYAAVPPSPPSEYDPGFLPPTHLMQLHLNTPNQETASDLRRERLSWIRYWFWSMALAVPVILLWQVQSPWICFLAAGMISLPFWLAGESEKEIHWIMAIGIPLLGLCMSLFPIDRRHRIAELVAGLGVLAILTGAVELIRYLLRNSMART